MNPDDLLQAPPRGSCRRDVFIHCAADSTRVGRLLKVRTQINAHTSTTALHRKMRGNVNCDHSRAGPLLTASLAIMLMTDAGLPPAHSEPATMNRCTSSIITFDGSGREIQRQMLKEIRAELARRTADIDGTVRAIGAAPAPSSDSEQVRAFGSRLEALSKAAHALEEQIDTVTSTPTTCNSNPKELSHE